MYRYGTYPTIAHYGTVPTIYKNTFFQCFIDYYSTLLHLPPLCRRMLRFIKIQLSASQDVLLISVGIKLLSTDITPKCNLGISHLIGHGELEEIQSVGIPLCDNMPMGTKRRGSWTNHTKRCNNPTKSSFPSKKGIYFGRVMTRLFRYRC